MRARLNSILTLFAACLVSHAYAHADIFRCDGVDGKTLFTNIACPPGTRPVTVVTSTEVCNGAQCESDRRETPEPSPAPKDVNAEKRRRVRDEAPPIDWPEAEEPVYAPTETVTPEASTPPDPLINAVPVYPAGVTPTIIVLPPSHHRPHPHRPDHVDAGQHRPDHQHHSHHDHDHDHHHGGGEMGSANPGTPKPMRDPNGSHSHGGVRGGSQGQQAADDKDGNRPAGPRQQPKDMRRNQL